MSSWWKRTFADRRTAPRSHPREPDQPERRVDASMSLLTNLMNNSLDEGYAEAAARRPANAAARDWRKQSWLLLVGLLAVGLLLSTAAAQAHDRASSTAEAGAALVHEIEARTSTNDTLEKSLERDRADVTATRRDALRLTAEGTALAARLTTLEVVTGASPVTGPALVVHLTDAPPSDDTGADVDPRTGDDTDGRVTDRDLQTIVNEVWASGAEAVAVNGQRLTALSAIRSAGDAILVDFRPLSPPYDIVGVGDARAMRASFAEGFGGSYLQALRDYGIGYSLSTKGSARLAESSGVMLRYAGVPTGTEIHK
jgi:uncharacterized protein YlxW (UPF0749 family)